MTFFLVKVLPWILSFNTIAVQYLAGNNYRYTWTFALCNQVLWFAWVFGSESWGFLPMNIALTLMFIRNNQKWLKLDRNG